LRPLIGIPTRTIQDPDGSESYGVRFTFPRAIERAGGAPVLVPLKLVDETLRAIFSRLDGLLLAGGVDVHPGEYGESVEDYCGQIDVHRDAVELQLIRWALDEKMPVFGICRGIQAMNIAAGGSLYQDIPRQLEGKLGHEHRKGDPYNLLVHEIELEPDSRLARTLGERQAKVNSLHHQSVKDVAPGFRVIARAPDGIIEGIEAVNGAFALGVQFHPEWLIDDDARMVRLFEDFVQASSQKKS
jgi:putative glutamine amidotransferase